MSQKPKEDKVTVTSSAAQFVACCQPSTITPDNSIVEESIEEISNNNTMFHMPETDKLDNIEKIPSIADTMDFSFPKRPKVDIEFQNVKYAVGKFSLRRRKFGKHFHYTYFI